MKSKATGCGSVSAVFSSMVLLCVMSIIMIIKIIMIIITTIIMIIIKTPVASKYRVEIRQGHRHGLQADEALFNLGWQSSRDGASIKILLVL